MFAIAACGMHAVLRLAEEVRISKARREEDCELISAYRATMKRSAAIGGDDEARVNATHCRADEDSLAQPIYMRQPRHAHI